MAKYDDNWVTLNKKAGMCDAYEKLFDNDRTKNVKCKCTNAYVYTNMQNKMINNSARHIVLQTKKLYLQKKQASP